MQIQNVLLEIQIFYRSCHGIIQKISYATQGRLDSPDIDRHCTSHCPMDPITMVLCCRKISCATREKFDPPNIVPITAVHLEGRVHSRCNRGQILTSILDSPLKQRMQINLMDLLIGNIKFAYYFFVSNLMLEITGLGFYVNNNIEAVVHLLQNNVISREKVSSRITKCILSKFTAVS